jgi:Domain of unknown function (DUF4424)
MINPCAVLSVAVIGAVLALSPALAQTKPTASEVPEVAGEPEESSLAVGALQIGSAATLAVAGFNINVATDSIVYSYMLKNTGTSELGLTAAVSLPELEASVDRSETWALASTDPEDPVGLTITAAGAPVTTKAEVHAFALGIDRLAEIEAEHLPLIPFGPEIDKTLAALSPEAADRLAALGVISPREPAHPKAPMTALWSLNVVRTWRQVLPAGETTPIVIKFTPVKAQSRIEKGDEEDLDDMKEQVCLKPPVLSALQSRLKGNGAWKVTDILVSVDPPAQGIDNPKAALSVQKPKPNAIVAFCGMDEKSASRPTVIGVAPDANDDDDDEIRIVIFEPIAIAERARRH